MRIVIYESSAHGGNFKYAIELFRTYQQQEKVENVSLLVPSNSPFIPGALPILLRDNIQGPKVVQQFYFLWRTLIDPFLLFFYLLKKEKSFVILNDFEQLSAPLWSWLFKNFLKQHTFSVYLHDPDRDNYPPSKAYTTFSMRAMMSCMKFGFYHEQLPQRAYYQNVNTKFISVPHGLYVLPQYDEKFFQEVTAFKKSSFLLAIVGNIRQEKNYEMAIRYLTSSADLTLLVAGSISNSSVNVEEWKRLAMELGVADRIHWCILYLSEEELAAAIKVCDCVLLNYSHTFTSQSGVLNMLAPFKKKVIISRTESALTSTAERFGLGEIILADSQKDLAKAILRMKSSEENFEDGWDRFAEYASWQNQINIVLNAFEGK